MKLTEYAAKEFTSTVAELHQGGHLALFNFDGDLLATGELANPPFTDVKPGKIQLNQPHSIELFQRAIDRMRPFMFSTFSKDGRRIIHATAGYSSDFLTPEMLVEDLATMKVRMSFGVGEVEPD